MIKAVARIIRIAPIVISFIVLFATLLCSCDDSQESYSVEDAYHQLEILCQIHTECVGDSDDSGGCVEAFSEYIKPNEENQACINVVTEWMSCLSEKSSCVEGKLETGDECESLEEQAEDCED